ncbi:putative hydrolase or acyltransferase of alpha/beta superfamily [Frankia sp. EI5c]|uniref:alpha/beta fold hydrolase n=1 Tax=Frankia sp. EI5c TaxID=683316 RepID=UPI0007C38E95|nr:alpha/beta hydrolase [Frankia sp. EI5c]OAA28142.1 putative hydrolase or acyltransferase of alpha/beta superfamily [Frankia sp. EI5c]
MPYFDLGVETRLFFTDDPAPGPAAGGPPLLLIHGWCCDSHDWNLQIPAFLDRHRVISPDLRGHGRSAGSKGLRPRVLAADAAALLRHVGVTAATGGVIAVGHSLGAMVASALAVEQPGLVRAVVAVEPAYGLTDAEADRTARTLGDLGAPGSERRLLRYLEALAGPEAPRHLTTWHRRRALGTPTDVARSALAGMWLDDDQFGRRSQSTDYLRRRGCPVLAVHSERQAGRAEWERGVATGPADAVHILPGGHWLHQEHPAAFNGLVLDWIARLGLADQSSRPRPGVSFL